VIPIFCSKDTHIENDLGAAILRELEAFILELGVGFSLGRENPSLAVDTV
jgi:predicted nuclease of restriction endonuclease-like (RecB) superfamily